MIIKPLITRFEKQDMHFVAKHGFFRAARLARKHRKKHATPFIADTYQLAYETGLSRRELFGLTRHPEYHYRILTLRKRNGGLRVLHAPLYQMKHAQQRILKRILSHLPVSPYATAYVPGKGLADNAAPHVGHKYLLKMDITDFFGSITYLQVISAAFPSTLYPPQIGAILTTLCCYKEVLPQGAPTSPVLSNIVMRHFDDAIGGWCKKRGIAYTRYCDDMTYSGMFDPTEVKSLVKYELKRFGFFINDKKTVVLRNGQRKVVTGIVVNEKPQTSAAYRRAIRQDLYYCRKYGFEAHLHKKGILVSPDTYKAQLLGRINYALSINPSDIELKEYREWLTAPVV